MKRMMIIVLGFITLSAAALAAASEIHEAIRSGDREKVEVLLKAQPESVNAKDEEYGRTPLLWAVAGDPKASFKSTGNEKLLVELLLANKADVNATEPSGFTALHWAAMKNLADVVDLLITGKADVNARTNTGATPLRYARDRRIVRSLRDAGARGGGGDWGRIRAGDTFLRAVTEGDVDEVRKTLEVNSYLANAHQDRNFRWTVLHEAVSEGRKSVVELLLEYDADPNTTNRDLETPLHWAVRKANLIIAEMLIKSKANVNARDVKGRTPLHEAASRGQVEITTLLLDNGADATIKDRADKTPLDLARESNRDEVVKLLSERAK